MRRCAEDTYVLLTNSVAVSPRYDWGLASKSNEQATDNRHSTGSCAVNRDATARCETRQQTGSWIGTGLRSADQRTTVADCAALWAAVAVR